MVFSAFGVTSITCDVTFGWPCKDSWATWGREAALFPLQCPLEDLRSSLHEPSTQRLALLSGSKVLEGLFPFRVACQGPSTTHASHLATKNGGGNHSIGFISSRRLLLKLSMYSQPSHNLQPFPFGGGDPQQRASVDTLRKRSKKKMGNHISGQKCLEGAYAPI